LPTAREPVRVDGAAWGSAAIGRSRLLTDIG
jgi:hypothetical protein